MLLRRSLQECLDRLDDEIVLENPSADAGHDRQLSSGNSRGHLGCVLTRALLRDHDRGDPNRRQDIRHVEIDLHAPELRPCRGARRQPVVPDEPLEVLLVLGPLRVELPAISSRASRRPHCSRPSRIFASASSRSLSSRTPRAQGSYRISRPTRSGFEAAKTADVAAASASPTSALVRCPPRRGRRGGRPSATRW